MTHLPILPIVLPMVVGAVLLLMRGSMNFKRGVSLLATSCVPARGRWFTPWATGHRPLVLCWWLIASVRSCCS